MTNDILATNVASVCLKRMTDMPNKISTNISRIGGFVVHINWCLAGQTAGLLVVNIFPDMLS